MEYKILLSTLAVAVELGSYAIYFVGIYKGKTKPHAFTWLAWGVANIIGFFAVFVSGGEAVAWILGINAIACLTISFIGFWQKSVQYDLYDWLAILVSFFGIILWWLSNNPLYAVIFVSISDTVAFVPTFRKAYRFPYEENFTSFLLGILYYFLAIFSLSSITLINCLYPLVIVVVDGLLVVLIYIRRKKFII